MMWLDDVETVYEEFDSLDPVEKDVVRRMLSSGPTLRRRGDARYEGLTDRGRDRIRHRLEIFASRNVHNAADALGRAVEIDHEIEAEQEELETA